MNRESHLEQMWTKCSFTRGKKIDDTTRFFFSIDLDRCVCALLIRKLFGVAFEPVENSMQTPRQFLIIQCMYQQGSTNFALTMPVTLFLIGICQAIPF